jgi:hypothetical protein
MDLWSSGRQLDKKWNRVCQLTTAGIHGEQAQIKVDGACGGL